MPRPRQELLLELEKLNADPQACGDVANPSPSMILNKLWVLFGVFSASFLGHQSRDRSEGRPPGFTMGNGEQLELLRCSAFA